MLENIFQTIALGSNVAFLDIPQEDYNLNHIKLDLNIAQELVRVYFKNNGKSLMAEVKDVDINSDINRVKITVEVKN
ncbi:hypothetical protein [Clostridium rectalis]|uniref:hypothetical protein n=1 Tax=Clostridium rectalis TaxID=2040295 RepID=UPI000F62FC09|nr:hypothetical protein [Clostridium rectalis]